MKLIVLCLNDYPIGIYSTEELADAAALVEWQQREPKWKEQGLKIGESSDTVGGKPFTFTKYYYHQHEFEVDAKAVL